MKAFLKNLEYYFSIESTKIENLTFPYETALSEVKTNTMESTKWTYRNAEVLPVTILFFLKTLFQFKDLLEGVDLI